MPDRQTLVKAKADVAAFARELVGQPLWSHQRQVVESSARIRCICSGRQAGKSRVLATESVWRAFAQPGARILIISAGESAARDLLAEVTGLTQVPWLGGSVVDENLSQVTLSNGSTIRSVPASVKQVRGKAVDLLIVDEACFVAEEIWRAAQFTVLSRPNSRIILASTPWGQGDRFFATCWRAGVVGEEGYASFHWPSTASPLVDQAWLEIQRKTMSERAFRAEILAEWTETEGQYFSPAELDAAVEANVPMVTAFDGPVNVGTDYGLVADANAVSVLATTERTQDGAVYRVLYVEEQFRVPYSRFVDHVADLGANGFRFARVFSECNGVGAAPTELLQTALYQRDARGYVVGVHTTAATKENAFGGLKTLAQQGRLQLPRHPSLLRQLANLEFAITESGNTKIHVPEHQGHDDLVMSLCLAAHDLPIQISGRRRGARTHFDVGQLQHRSMTR